MLIVRPGERFFRSSATRLIESMIVSMHAYHSARLRSKQNELLTIGHGSLNLGGENLFEKAVMHCTTWTYSVEINGKITHAHRPLPNPLSHWPASCIWKVKSVFHSVKSVALVPLKPTMMKLSSGSQNSPQYELPKQFNSLIVRNCKPRYLEAMS